VFQLPNHGDGALAGVADLRTAAEELERGRQGAVGAVQPHKKIDGITARGVLYQVLPRGAGLRGSALGLPVQAGQIDRVVFIQSGGRKSLSLLFRVISRA